MDIDIGVKDEAGRWIIPEQSGLPSLVVMNPADRAAICDYFAKDDVLGQFTTTELLCFSQYAWVDAYDEDPKLRTWDINGRRIYGMYGFPKLVAGEIRKLARQHGVCQSSIAIPIRDAEKQCFFILGAQRI